MKSKGVFVRGPAQTPVRDRSSARIRGVAWRCVGAAAVLMTGLQLASAQMSLPGKFSVNNQGAATFSVSIAVPPGTAGMIPALTLDYTSQSTSQTGGGLLGIGWSLGGLLSITHCPKTVTQDGGFGGVNFDANDRYCLDGQRLVAISGGYGADGTEYRTEVESFSRVISHGVAGSAPQWWEVHTKTGQVMEFGHTADSALVLHNQSSVFGWALSKMSDTKGNYYTITYTNDATNGQVYPIEIDYTGNAAASLAPYNKVQFVYATRPDVTPQYVAGSLNQITVRLTDVKTYADTSLVADYRLGYRQMTMSQASQLTSITLCASDGSCLPATFLAVADDTNWQLTILGQGYGTGTTLGTPPRNYGSIVTGDFDGDGKTDYLYANATNYVLFRSNGDGTFAISGAAYGSGLNLNGTPPTANYDLVVGDFNGDGKTDFAFVGSTVLFSFISRGDGTFAFVGQGYPSGTTLGSPPRNYGSVITGDFNGDGKTDFVYANATNYVTFRSNGDGTFAISGAAYGGGINLQGPPPTSIYDLVVGDFNGDGKTDFAYVGSTLVFSFISRGDGTFTASGQGYPTGTTLGSPPRNYGNVITGDFNGDGKTDFVYTNSTNYVTFRSNGDGTFAISGAAYGGGINLQGPPPTSVYDLVVGDFNGDGKTDFAYVGNQLQFSFLSKGDGTFTASGQGYPTGTTLGSPPRNYGNVITGDFNGDGKTDFVYTNSTNYVTFRSNGDGTFAISGAAYGGGINLQGPPPTSVYDLVVGDFNGDGKTDFAYVGNQLQFSFLSKGDGSFSILGQGYPGGTTLGSPPRNYGTIITGDFNGDGKSDFAYVNNTNYVIFRANGDGTFGLAGAADGGGINLLTPPTGNYDLVVGDFNGDGKTDFAFVGSTLQFSFRSDGAPRSEE